MNKYTRRTIVALALMGLTASALAAPSTLWSISFDKDIKWMRLMETGHLVASTDEGLVGIDPESGQIVWQQEEWKGLKEDRFDAIPFTQYGVVQTGKGVFGAHNKMVVIDYVSGQEKWNSDKLDILSSMGQFILPEVSALFIHGRNGKGKEWPRVANLETGDLLWENQDFFKGRKAQVFQLSASKQTLVGNQEPLFDTDKTFITFMNKKAIRKWNAKTSELVWENELKCKAAPALKQGFCPMFLNKDATIVYVAADKRVYPVRTSDGTLVWEKPKELKGMVYQMLLLPQGLLVKGGPNQEGKGGDPFMMLLDRDTGEKKWQDEFKKLKKSTNFIVENDKALVVADKKLYSVNIADGKYREIAKDLKFEGSEYPGRLAKRDEGFYLGGDQNLMMLSPSGELIYHTYHKAMGGSLFGKIATTAVIGVSNYGSAMHALDRAQYEASRSVTGRGSAKYKLISSNPYLSLRYKATKDGYNYKYILTKVETEDDQGPGIVKVSKATGETVGRIVLGYEEAHLPSG